MPNQIHAASTCLLFNLKKVQKFYFVLFNKTKLSIVAKKLAVLFDFVRLKCLVRQFHFHFYFIIGQLKAKVDLNSKIFFITYNRHCIHELT